MPPKRRPWYSFLYILFGAQGSFFLWLAALGGVYWTFEDAVLWAFNPEPADVEVSEAARLDRGPRRWVRLHGVQVALDPGAGAAAKEGRDVSVLIDPQDPAALRWRELFRRMRDFRLETINVDKGLDAETLELRKELDFVVDEDGTRLKRLPADSPYFPRSWIAIVDERGDRGSETPPLHVTPGPFDPQAPPGAGPGPGEPGGGGAGIGPSPSGASGDFREVFREFLAKQARRMEVVRRAVRPDVDPSGLLEPTSPGVTVRVEPYGFENGRFVLRAGERPSGLKAGLFAVFSGTLFFLLVGLRGLGHRDEAAAPAPAATAPPAAAPGRPARPAAEGPPPDRPDRPSGASA